MHFLIKRGERGKSIIIGTNSSILSHFRIFTFSWVAVVLPYAGCPEKKTQKSQKWSLSVPEKKHPKMVFFSGQTEFWISAEIMFVPEKKPFA